MGMRWLMSGGIALALLGAMLLRLPVIQGTPAHTPEAAGTPILEATPDFGSGEGAERRLLVYGVPVMANGLGLDLSRVTLPPGASVPADAYVGSGGIYVESGSVAFTALEGTIRPAGGRITLAGTSPATPVSGTPEGATGEPLPRGPFPLDVEVLLDYDDAVFYADAAAYTYRNAGTEPAVLLISALVEPTQGGCAGRCYGA